MKGAPDEPGIVEFDDQGDDPTSGNRWTPSPNGFGAVAARRETPRP